MATIWKSCGTVGDGSTDAGTDIPLDIIDERLRAYQLSYRGQNPSPIHPQTRYYTHLVVEVSDAADQARSERFGKPGFYLVVALNVEDAGFLFEPYVFVPFDKHAKDLLVHFPVNAVVTRDPSTGHMTIELGFRNAPERNKVAHSKAVEAAHANEQFVDRMIKEFLMKNGVANFGDEHPLP